ncbi:VanZ family protein [Aliivibrio sp. S4TY2]|uniref:VanZ family protein n=1 Tax=unclassified Aliivibrio TaxID=2645654 RepID=UPI002378F9B6|nr:MULTISPECIES: VanZ family protein [unclassified Aliivibrio]MDD9156060.1 VanZ family protein [Aliivibrio sp. S4TY2]MDD9159769.1 VanZ family protein [Aliivibrio sp. S4TY1]MDD9163767.1 VanZ family protein [Aliivibrio sp. S4MY2]MDD9167769.1 VanZ family protein [Aliivibrio sp. S4MY4]MDD9185567.1 VanZ family protein [Aliivibrio sp. S4MY3]
MGKIAKMPFTILITSVLLFGSASIFKSSGILGNEIRTVEIAIHGAIYLHLFASLLLGIFCRLATKQNLCLALPPTTVFVLLLVILDESIQFFIPSRQFSWLDMQVNVFGVLLGTYFTNAVLWHNSKRKALL